MNSESKERILKSLIGEVERFGRGMARVTSVDPSLRSG